tara:strand:+ start:3937 stop:4263 length:327 start_codon:yes stop_codon:yes gene_type:complete
MEYVVGDTTLLKVTCEEDGAAIDVSSANLTAYLRWSLNGAASGTPEAMSEPGGGTDGIVQYRWKSTDLSAAGTIEFEVYIVDNLGDGDASNDLTYTSQTITRDIRAKL